MNLMNHARMTTRGGDDAMLEGVKASGDLRGVLLEMSVEQRFRNPSDQNVEIIYSFPLPWGAVLLDVSVQLGERHLSSAVVEKNRPRRATRKHCPKATPPSCWRKTTMAATA